MVRSNNVPNNKKLLARVDDIAKGAALMTGTSFKRRFIDGTADLLPNEALERALYANMEEIPLPEYTKEERDFAAKLDATCPNDGRGSGRSTTRRSAGGCRSCRTMAARP